MNQINQNESDDLIYDLSKIPSWLRIPYVSGGLYDRVINNIRSHSNQPLLLDQEEYQWFRRPSDTYNVRSKINAKVELIKPGIKESELIFRYGNKLKNKVTTLTLAFYNSATDISINGVTWVAESKALKPLKILKHRWEKTGYVRDTALHKCEVCGMEGFGRFYTSNYQRVKSAIMPKYLLTCDQAIIMDIIV